MPHNTGIRLLGVARNSANGFPARPLAPGNPNQPRRQPIYLRALATLRGFGAYYGTFRCPLAEPLQGRPAHVLVRDSEEKGSDVNLATRLLVDGFNYERAVVVLNDVRDDPGPH